MLLHGLKRFSGYSRESVSLNPESCLEMSKRPELTGALSPGPPPRALPLDPAVGQRQPPAVYTAAVVRHFSTPTAAQLEP